MIKKRRGQFQVLAAFLVLIILGGAIISSYKKLGENAQVEPVKVSNTVNEVNTSIWKLLGFATGYYSSIIDVTGNYTYAQNKTKSYLQGGLQNIAEAHPDWGVSFNYGSKDLAFQTNWFDSTSWTKGNWTITYSVPTLGLYGIKVNIVTAIEATIGFTDIVGGKYYSHLNITSDNGQSTLVLTKDDFKFFKYDSANRKWTFVNLVSEPTLTSTGEYQIEIPPGVDQKSYYIQVTDQRGIHASAAFVQGLYDPIKNHYKNQVPSYSYKINYRDLSLYNSLTDDRFTLELLQNGTIRWLGIRMPVNDGLNPYGEKPIPPIPVKSLRVNASSDSGVHWSAIPFQVEYWGNNYEVPMGLANVNTIFDENCMIVFQVTHSNTNIRIWWVGRDTAVAIPQTSQFNDDPANSILRNGKITLLAALSDTYSPNERISATFGTLTADAYFLRFNDPSDAKNSNQVMHSGISYTIINGIVRDVIQQEPEWSGGISGLPDTLAHIIIMLPAKTTYYTYKLHVIFLPTTQTRTLSELSVIRLTNNKGTLSYKIENGYTTGTPNIITTQGYYGTSDGGGIHRWSEYISGSTGAGSGLMVNMGQSQHKDSLYCFNNDTAPASRGYLRGQNGVIEWNPQKNGSTTDSFQTGRTIIWNGAVVLFDGTSSSTPIYPNSGKTGLWVMVDEMPTFTIQLG